MEGMTRNPEQSQEPQHLKCGVIAANNVGAAKNHQFSGGLEFCFYPFTWEASEKQSRSMLLANEPMPCKNRC